MESNEIFDVAVIGGGTAGSIAAISAARLGAKTVVVEQTGHLGGVLSLGMAFLGPADGEGYWSLGGVGRELVNRAGEWGGLTEPHREPKVGSKLAQDPEILKLVLLEMARESGLRMLLHSTLVDARVEDDVVTELHIANKSGVQIIRAKSVVDCTGDADLVAKAGGGFTFGRGDSLAQPVSRIFKVGNVDMDAAFDYLEANPQDRMGARSGDEDQPYPMDFLRATDGVSFDGFQTLVKQAKEDGEFDIPRAAMIVYTYPGRNEVGINITRVQGVDSSDPWALSDAEVETQLQILVALKFLRRYVPGFEHAYISSAPHALGIRESRHIHGHYTLTKDDLFEGRDFEDQIGRCSYPFDIHDVKPGEVMEGRSSRGGITLYKIEKSFAIPLRSLIPNTLKNVSVGGRCISADHGAGSSVRGQAACMVSGQAAGTVAALGAIRGIPLIEVPVSLVQSTLVENGALLERTELAEFAQTAHQPV